MGEGWADPPPGPGNDQQNGIQCSRRSNGESTAPGTPGTIAASCTAAGREAFAGRSDKVGTGELGGDTEQLCLRLCAFWEGPNKLYNPPNLIINMRYSTAAVALLAGAVMAVPQYGDNKPLPISQIGDGQIQAPPASTVAPIMPTATSVGSAPGVPAATTGVSTSAVTLTATLTSTNIMVVPTATPVAPVSTMVTPIVGSNSTMPAAGTGASSSPASTGSAAASSSAATSRGSASGTRTGSAPESTGAAAGNMVSFGGLVFAIGAAIFA
ncbi:hypothetical protein CFE70_001250 [Pyrenophora teres f. teres 0-1]